jgi:hypothetical protein
MLQNKALIIFCIMFAVVPCTDRLIEFQNNEKVSLELWKR